MCFFSGYMDFSGYKPALLWTGGHLLQDTLLFEWALGFICLNLSCSWHIKLVPGAFCKPFIPFGVRINHHVPLYLNYHWCLYYIYWYVPGTNGSQHLCIKISKLNSARLQVFTLNHLMPLFYEKIWNWADGSCKKFSFANCMPEGANTLQKE